MEIFLKILLEFLKQKWKIQNYGDTSFVNCRKLFTTQYACPLEWCVSTFDTSSEFIILFNMKHASVFFGRRLFLSDTILHDDHDDSHCKPW